MGGFGGHDFMSSRNKYFEFNKIASNATRQYSFE